MTDTAPTVGAGVVEHANGILASTDLMDEIIRDVEAHTDGEAVFLHHTMAQVIAKAKLAQAALELHLLDVLEVPIDHAGWQYRRGRKKDRERFDHREIGKRVHKFVDRTVTEQYAGDEAIAYGNGVHDGAAEAIRIMSDLYLSDSVTAKVGQLDRLGIPRNPKTSEDSVRTWVKGDRYIDVSPIMSQVQE